MEVYAIITDENFKKIPSEIRELFKHWEMREKNEYENHKEDLKYLMLKSAEKKAKKNLQTYLFNKRH